MKKIFVAVSVISLGICALGFTFFSNLQNGTFLLDRNAEDESEENNLAKEAAEYRQSRMLDENGEYKSEYFAQALAKANALKQSGSRAGTLNMDWEEIGPNNVGGRTRGLIYDNTDPTRKTLWGSGVGGGLWKSTTGGDTWSRIELPDVISISCMAQASNGIIYIATGEGLSNLAGSRFSSGNVGNGIYKLNPTNGNIEHLQSTKQSGNITNADTWSEINRIAIDPNNPDHIFAGTVNGLQETSDGGQTWNAVTNIKNQNGSNASGTYFSNCADIDFSADGQYVYATLGGGGQGGKGQNLAYSSNAGVSWITIPYSGTASQPLGSPIFLPNFKLSGKGRIEIAPAKSDPSVVYLSICNNNGTNFHGYKTSDNGQTWLKIGESGSTFQPFGDNGQGWYDNVIAVNPFDADQVFLGGTQLYTYSSQSGWKLATIYFGEPSNQYWIHADLHCITFNDLNKNEVFIGCDGGYFKSTQAYDKFPNPPFYVKNRGFSVTQAYSVAAGPTGDVMCGNQDNGTTYVPFNYSSTGSAKSIRGGDGVFTEISTINENVFIYGVYYGDIWRSNNKGVAGSYFYDNAIDPNGGNQPTRCGSSTNNTRFITNFFLEETREARNTINQVPFVADKNYNAGDVVTVTSRTKATFTETLSTALNAGATTTFPDRIQSRFYLPTNCGLWMTPDVLDFGGTTRWFRIQNSVNPNALAQTPTGDTLYYTVGAAVRRIVGMNTIPFDSALVKSGSGTTLWNKMPGVPSNFNVPTGGRTLEGIAVDKNNSRHLITVASGFSSNAVSSNVFKSTDGGQTWTNISNNLPNIPVYSCVIDANNPQNYIIGTELGVWTSSDGGATWVEENTKLGRVPVFAVRQIRYLGEDCHMIYLGTHGRGMWRSSTLLKGGCQLNALGIKDPANQEKLNQLVVFPVPMASKGKIELDMAAKGNVIFRLIDLPGRLVKEINAGEVAEGKQTFDLDVADLSRGTYVLTATVDNKKTYSRTFNINR